MFIEGFKDKTQFKDYMLLHHDMASVILFYDIETLRYNSDGVHSKKGYKPTNYKNIMYSFAVSYIYDNQIETVSFFNYCEFVRFMLKITKNKTNDNSKYSPVINLIAYNNNKYDNHFLLRESLVYLDPNIKCKNMYLKNAIDHTFEVRKKEISRKEKLQGLFLEKRIKSSNNLEFEFFYKGLSFKTSDFIMKTNTNLATIGKKLFNLNLIEEKHLKTDFNYREFDLDHDMTDNEALQYARYVYDKLEQQHMIYIENDVIILGLGYMNYDKIFKDFSLDKLTFSSNVLESYLVNDTACFQLLNRTLDYQTKIDFTKFTFNNENFYDYLKRFYKGGLNFYNALYIAQILREPMFSIDINSSYPFCMHGFEIPTFLHSFSTFVKPEKLSMKKNDYFYIYTVDKNIFNDEILIRIDSLVVRQMLVKYYATSQSFVSINSNTIRMIEDITHITIDDLTVISYIEYETCDFGAKHKLEEYYFIKSQGKIKNILEMTSPYEYQILEELNENVFSQSEIDIAKVYMNGIYGIPALRPYFNIFYRIIGNDFKNAENNFQNSKRNILFSIFVTSVALYNLLKPLSYLTADEIDECFVYCDTDSLYLLRKIMHKMPKEMFDPIKLGAWDIENDYISSFYVLNHKKYAYYTEDSKKIKIRSGGIRHASFNTDMPFDTFIKTQFHDGATVQNTRSIMNAQGVISIYEAETKLDKGGQYPSMFSQVIDKQRKELKERIKAELEEQLDDYMYIESELGSFSSRDLYERKEKADGYHLNILQFVYQSTKNYLLNE